MCVTVSSQSVVPIQVQSRHSPFAKTKHMPSATRLPPLSNCCCFFKWHLLLSTLQPSLSLHTTETHTSSTFILVSSLSLNLLHDTSYLRQLTAGALWVRGLQCSAPGVPVGAVVIQPPLQDDGTMGRGAERSGEGAHRPQAAGTIIIHRYISIRWSLLKGEHAKSTPLFAHIHQSCKSSFLC